MRIERLYIEKIEHRPLLNGLELLFYHDKNGSIEPNCFIGVNGSGKSQVLETIAEVFYYLDKLYGNPYNITIVPYAPLLFELDYTLTIKNKEYLIQIKQHQPKGKAPKILITQNGKDVEWHVDSMHLYLPKKIIAYTSGANETLSFPFLDYYDEYAEFTAKRALGKEKGDDYDPRFYLMDYSTNIGVVITNLVYSTSKQIKQISGTINVNSLRSFQIIIQTKHKAAPLGGVKLTDDLKGWILDLKKSATCFDYIEKEDKYILDFYNNKATKDALLKYFPKAIDFYTALYKIELLNNLMIDDRYLAEIKKKRRARKSLIRNPIVPEKDKVLNYSEIKLRHKSGELINYLSLSDGEHQFMNVFGTILMSDFDNALFLLDEPETHFNPKWRREFMNNLNEIAGGRYQDYFITSHSPFIVADSKREKVYIFKKDAKNKLEVKQPINETYGSNFDYILKMAFEMESTISQKSLDEIHELQKSKSIQDIEKGLVEFGDSSEKLYLLRRIEELKK